MQEVSPQLNTGHNQSSNEHYMVEDKGQFKCVCELCSCGKHRCPRPKVKGDFQTSYSNHYKPIANSPSQRPLPPYQYQERHYNPDSLKTHYQENYQPILTESSELKNSRFQVAAREIVMPKVPFQGSSSYKDQYKPFTIQPVDANPEAGDMGDSKLRVPDYSYRSPVKFEGVSAYNLSYVQPPPPQPLAPSPYQYRKSEAPFYGSSSYKQDFQGYKIEPMPESYGNEPPNVPRVKFQGKTSYNDHYKGFEMKPRERQVCAVERMNVPSHNYINNQEHIYFDHLQKKFI